MTTPSNLLTYADESLRNGATLTELSRELKIPRTTLREALARYRQGDTTTDEAANPEPITLDDLQRYLDKRKLPPVPKYLKATKLADMDFNTPQPEIALFSDLHLGSEIDRRVTNGAAEYSVEIAVERLGRWRNGVLRFLQLDGMVMEIPSLHIFALGDDFEGHGDMFPTQKLQMGENIMFQYSLFVELMTDALLSLLERVPKIVVYKVPGNHGRVFSTAKADYPPDNFELMAWQNIADRVARQTGGEWSETPNGIRALTGGKIDFYLSHSFFITAMIAGKLIYARHGHKIGGLNRTYCVTPETRILTQDLHWIPAGKLQEGQPIIGFDEETRRHETAQRPYRYFQRAVITRAKRSLAPVYELTLADGRTVRATGEHKWIVRLPGNDRYGQRWMSTAELFARKNGAARTNGHHNVNENKVWLPRHVLPWNDGGDRDYYSGFLAGAFDADGSIGKGKSLRWPVVRFTQYDNALLVAVKEALTQKGFSFVQRVSKTPSGKPIVQLTLSGGRNEHLRFLAQIRPPRLMQEWDKFPLDERRLQSVDETEILTVREAGVQEIIELTSSSGTYITEHGSSHNTGAIDNMFRINAIIGRVCNYMFKAHLHEAQEAEPMIGGQVIQNACFVGPSLLSIEGNRPSASLPSQEMYAIHPKYGLTHHHRIYLATASEIQQTEAIDFLANQEIDIVRG